jgi:hypothetical protein
MPSQAQEVELQLVRLAHFIQAMHVHKAGVRCILAAGLILFISGELGEGRRVVENVLDET